MSPLKTRLRAHRAILLGLSQRVLGATKGEADVVGRGLVIVAVRREAGGGDVVPATPRETRETPRFEAGDQGYVASLVWLVRGQDVA